MELDRRESLPTTLGIEKELRPSPCLINVKTLKEIYKAMKQAADEAVTAEISTHHANAKDPATAIAQVQNDGDVPKFEDIIKEYGRVGIIITGTNGERVVSYDEESLNEANLPKPLQSVIMETGLALRTLQPPKQPRNRANIIIDFTKPPLIDTTNPSEAPIQNGSSFYAFGESRSFVSGVYIAIEQTLERYKTWRGLLYKHHMYDILLIVLGFPFAIFLATLFDSFLTSQAPDTLSHPLIIAVDVYVFLVAVYIFRISFGIVRWLYPYMEEERNPNPAYVRFRLLVTAFIGVVFAAVIAVGIEKILQGTE